MKKILVGFLTLALCAGVFAQEEKEQGLQFGGALKTGFQFQTSDADAEPAENGDEGGKYDPSIRLYSDDADAETRLDLNGSFTKDNYGVVFRLRTDTVITGPEVKVNQAYVWADFLNDVINVKAGIIDDSAWNTGGDEDFHYSTGRGLRLEVKPIEGLNVGLFLNSQDGDLISTAASNGKSGADAKSALEASIFAKEFLMETSFGAKYESDLFDFAAGLRIDSKADGLTTDKFYDKSTASPNFSSVPPADPPDPPVDPENKDAGKGLGAYAGFAVKAVPNLTAIVEARFNNLGDYNKYGWIWINETLGYAVTEQFEAGLVMHQRLFGKDALLINNESAAPYLTFKPYVSYALNDLWTVGLDVPVGLWTDVVDYDIGVKPKVGYKVGENASINAWYKFGLLQKTGADDSVMTNTVQLDFVWTF
ncbi:hypothetical protein Holit_02847 [Hollandina sp. SP2]